MRKPAFLTKAGEWLKRHKADVVVVVALMAIGGTVSGLNMTGYPQRFEDEGTYVSQAWAIKENNTLAHYTYWYDHPPAGWIQIAAYLTVFQGLERYGSAITAGREFMLVLHIATIGLLYALARRLAIGRIAAFAGVLFYALSPLTVEFGRYVLLDNVALPWLLGAFLLALSPKRSLGTGVGAAACMAIAILSKETFLALLPVLLYCLWRSGDPRNRRYVIAVFSVVFVMLSATYVLYAALKNELFPGAGHVSLIGTFFWQLFGREGTGSIFDPGSDGYGLVAYWLDIDYILLAAGAISMLPALIFRNLRPAGLVMFISLALMLRNGYLPYPYVIILLPFAALCVAGAIDRLLVRSIADRRHWLPLRLYAGVAAAELLVAIALFVVPVWQQKLTTAMTADVDNTSRMAVEWVKDNVASSGRLVVESALWTDLETQGFT
ncbi:MAG TPA: glycosyltransferase family 39 protein, partial [Candidatus Saccharimonadales bacterium]|nr:glycosyltransferase family 39 protein [Candidatus Saccharimonadales bacterium]